jgi:hypothetical protein
MSSGVNLALWEADVQEEIRETDKFVLDAIRTLCVRLIARFEDESPIDEGRFQGSWRGDINNLDETVLPKPPEDGRGTASGNLPFYNESFVVELHQRLKELGLSDNVIISNCLDYAEDLANGASPKAGPGWIDAIIFEITGSENK